MTLAIDTSGRTTLAPIDAGAERPRDAAAAAAAVSAMASISSLQTENSPFSIGLTGHPDLDPAQLPQLVAEVVAFLQEVKQHLPDTEVCVLLDAGTQFSAALVPAVPPLHVRVDALNLDLDPMPVDTLLRRSSLLLVLWDGKPSSAPGDTAELVFRFVGVGGEQGEAVHRIEVSTAVHDLDVTARLVYWVPAWRATDVDPGGGDELPGNVDQVPGDAPRQPYYLLSVGDSVLEVQHSMPSSLKRRLADLNEYNVNFGRFAADERQIRSASLMPRDCASMAMSDASVLEAIDRQFIRADSLAGYMQRRSDRLFNTFGIAAFTMGIAYLIYDKVNESRILLLFYMVILLLSLLVYYFFQTKRWFSKYLSYRSLAETLRVRFYLALAGLERRMHTRELIALTGIYRFPGFGWISFALDSIEPTTVEAPPSAGEYALRSRIVDQAWVDDQYRYFVRKVATMERHRSWIGQLKRGVFVTGLIVLTAMFMFSGALHHVDVRTGLPLKNLLTLCSGTLAVVLGVWELRQNKMAVQELLWQYRNQLSQFQRARLQLQRTTIRARRDEILKQLGENSLMEIYLWATHRYHREHAPPSAH